MAEYQIPISYVVSASAVLPQASLEPLKLSTILILTDDEPVTEVGDYEIYRTVTSASKVWGTESTTTKMIQAIFAQSPNILNNDGYVIVAPYENTPATAGTLTTADISANVDNFKAISDGAINITVDDVTTSYTGLSFTEITSLSDIATVLNNQIANVTVTNVDNTIVFTSKTTGIISSVIIEEASSGTDLFGANYLNIETATTTQGTDAIVETYSTAITRLSGQIYFNGILTTKTLGETEAINASNTVQALTPARMLFLEASDTSALTGLFADVKTNYYTKTLLYTYGNTPAVNAKLFASAYASKLLSVNYSGTNTCITMNLKDLAGISADTNISETILSQCVTAGCDVYCSVEGLAKVLSNRQGSYYADQVQNMIWLVNTLQRNVFNLLASTNTKIPQTEQGMQQITNTISQVCKQGVTNGYLAGGTWNSADTFGVYEDFIRNIEENGYYIYHVPVSQQSQTEREARKAPMFQIACKEAGAVHSVNILIYIEP